MGRFESGGMLLYTQTGRDGKQARIVSDTMVFRAIYACGPGIYCTSSSYFDSDCCCKSINSVMPFSAKLSN